MTTSKTKGMTSTYMYFVKHGLNTPTTREVNQARRPHTCSRPCAFEVKKTKKKTKSHQTLKNTPRNISTAARRPRTTSRRHAAKHVPQVSPYSHASSIDPGFVARLYTYILAQLLCRLYAFGATLFSRQRNLFIYCCDMCLRFRGCPVVLDIELSVSA